MRVRVRPEFWKNAHVRAMCVWPKIHRNSHSGKYGIIFHLIWHLPFTNSKRQIKWPSQKSFCKIRFSVSAEQILQKRLPKIRIKRVLTYFRYTSRSAH